jgi:hypothetical protein
MVLVILSSCKKENTGGNPPPPPPGNDLSYEDSIFYLKNQASDYIVLPLQNRQGQYSGFPEGIDIDQNSGAINISKSETGLRYRISFVPAGTTDSIHTVIVISGINFLDGFYKLTTADSVIRPLYNANANSSVPGVSNGTAFDIGSGCNSAGCNVNIAVGSINLAQTVRNGVFGATPSNNDRHEFDLNYEINDKSGKAPNTIRVKLYYFDSISDVTQEVYDIINSREGALFGVQPRPIPFASSMTSINSIGDQTAILGKAVPKPRPPCIFILSR